jgi:hypothetical protein
VDFKPSELANKEKLKRQLKKIKAFYDKYLINITNSNDEENKPETDNE